MKIKSSIVRVFTFLCIVGLLLNSEAVFAQGEGETTPASNTTPTIVLNEPQQNIIIQAGEKVTITWTDDDPDDNALVGLAYDIDSDPTNDDPIRWIAQNLPEDPDEDGDRFEWDTTGIPAGTYYIWAVISDSVNAPTYALAAGTLTILEAQAPTQEPTQAPTEEPTALPTEEPTQVPTEEPTVVPSEEPTVIPTQEPTVEPTAIPTIAPTQKPSPLPTPTQSPSGSEYYTVSSVKLKNGSVVMKTTINGPSEAPKDYQRAVINLSIDSDEPIQKTQQMAALTVPAFNWSFGCSATSAAMIAGYYDRYGYPNIYTGPTNGGVMPLDNSSWPDWVDSGGDTRHQCPLSATHLNLDGRTTRGHVDDYWIEYESTDTDPWVAYGSEHAYGDCTADYMKTSQNQHGYSNSDGATSFYWYSSGDALTCDAIDAAGIKDDGTAGFRDFLESRGYAVTDCYMKATSNQSSSNGFTFAQYKAEIDAGYPVMIQLLGHTVVGIGYTGTDTVILHDTWDYENHTMTWGGSYVGMDMWGVSIVHIDDTESQIPAPTSPSGTITDSTPTYSWSKVNSATKYQYQLYQGSTRIYTYTVSAGVCGTTNCSHTPTTALSAGAYQWRVGAYVDEAWQTFSTNKTFTLTIPVTPAPISPNSTINDTTPTYTWSKISGATKYQYQLYQGSTRIYAYTVSSGVCGTSKCTNTPTRVLGTGSYQWRVGAYVDGAWKAFSAFKPFKVSLSPTPISPAYWERSIKPTYIWSKIAGASQYQYQLVKNSSVVYTQTVTSSGCGTSKCSSTPTTALNGGEYQWRVRAYLNGAWQAFSPYMDFEIDLTPIPWAPENTITDTTPTYSWYGLPDATKYELQLYKGSTQVYAKTASSSICDDTGYYCYYTPTTVLSAGSYKWRVRMYVNNTWQAFSTFTNFTLVGSGSEYFNTQFNTEASFEGWAAGPGSDWFVEGGNLHTTGLSNRDTSSVNYERATNLSNFTYQVHMKMADPMNDLDYYGLIVRGIPEYDSNNDWTNGYYFVFTQDYSSDYACFDAYQITDGQWTSLTSGYMYCYGSINFADWNDFKVVANGTNIKLYVNEDLIFNTTVSGSMSGRVGIFTWHYYGDYEQNLYIDWAKAGLPIASDGAQETLLKPDKIIKSDLSKFKTQ